MNRPQLPDTHFHACRCGLELVCCCASPKQEVKCLACADTLEVLEREVEACYEAIAYRLEGQVN